jgi:hypothetical protein
MSRRLWLSDSDFLPKRFPQAHVILFGYYSNVAFQTSTAGVRKQAENLLNRLRIERRVIPCPYKERIFLLKKRDFLVFF